MIQVQRDRALVKAVLKGDEHAFRRLVDEYFPKLYRYARHRLANEADVEEVVQTVLTQAARRLETYRGEATLLTWLVQICRHEISRQLTRVGKQRDLMQPFLNDELLRSVIESVATDPSDDPEQQAHRGELILLVQFALDQLPEHYARALELKYVEGYNSREIAESLRISDQATQSLLARARRSFREVCGESFQTFYAEGGVKTPG